MWVISELIEILSSFSIFALHAGMATYGDVVGNGQWYGRTQLSITIDYIRSILEAAGCPLAIVLTSSYLRRSLAGVTTVLEEFRHHKKTLIRCKYQRPLMTRSQLAVQITPRGKARVWRVSSKT